MLTDADATHEDNKHQEILRLSEYYSVRVPSQFIKRSVNLGAESDVKEMLNQSGIKVSSQHIRSAAILCHIHSRHTQRRHDIPYAMPSQYGPVLNYYLLMQHKHLYATQVSTDGRQRDSVKLAILN